MVRHRQHVAPQPVRDRDRHPRHGTVVLFSGATDIGQGSNTILAQIAADALGVPVASIERVGPDTDLTPDAGKTSASRQTFVSGNATRIAGEDLRRQLLTLAEAGPDATLELDGGRVAARDGKTVSVVRLRELPVAARDCAVLDGGPTRRPRRSIADGQGVPYETYAFGAQIAEVDVDLDLGTVRCAGSSRPTTSDGRSTRRWSRARSRAASCRAWAWR